MPESAPTYDFASFTNAELQSLSTALDTASRRKPARKLDRAQAHLRAAIELLLAQNEVTAAHAPAASAAELQIVAAIGDAIHRIEYRKSGQAVSPSGCVDSYDAPLI